MVKRGAARRCKKKKKKVAPLPTDEGRAMSGRKRRHREEPCSICDHYHDVSGKASVSALAPWRAEPEKRAGDAREKRVDGRAALNRWLSRSLDASSRSFCQPFPPNLLFSASPIKTPKPVEIVRGRRALRDLRSHPGLLFRECSSSVGCRGRGGGGSRSSSGRRLRRAQRQR